MDNQVQLTPEQEIVALKEQIAKLSRPTGGIKAGDKGGVVVSVGQRYPVTLYPEQWPKLFAKTQDIARFITENADKLNWKASGLQTADEVKAETLATIAIYL